MLLNLFSHPRVKDGAPSTKSGKPEGPCGHGQSEANDGPRRHQPEALELPLETRPVPEDGGRESEGGEKGLFLTFFFTFKCFF